LIHGRNLHIFPRRHTGNSVHRAASSNADMKEEMIYSRSAAMSGKKQTTVHL
jgi:hypothetical protein